MKIKNHFILLTLLCACFSLFLISCIPPSGDKDAITAAPTHPEVVHDVGCVECHTSETPEITQLWAGSAHGKLNFGCYICHGDGDVNFTNKPMSDNCISCHSSSQDHYEEVEGEHCFDCHNGHSLAAE